MGHKLRIGVRSASLLVVSACICVQLSGGGIWIDVPGLLNLLIVMALVWLVVDFAALSVAASTWRTRLSLGAVTAASAFVAIAFGNMALHSRSLPITELGEVQTAVGRWTTVALVKIPLSGDFVVIERRIYLMPGVYFYRIIDKVDAAWDAQFQLVGGVILLSYNDNEHKRHQKQLHP